MAIGVTMGATLQCSFGAAPSTMVVPPASCVMAGTPMANIMDFKPIGNIPPFGVCMSLANPTVAAATSAALGVLTPMPCVPVTTPWVPGGPTALVGNMPVLNNSSKCMCSWGGVIQVIAPSQFTTMVP